MRMMKYMYKRVCAFLFLFKRTNTRPPSNKWQITVNALNREASLLLSNILCFSGEWGRGICHLLGDKTPITVFFAQHLGLCYFFVNISRWYTPRHILSNNCRIRHSQSWPILSPGNSTKKMRLVCIYLLLICQQQQK